MADMLLNLMIKEVSGLMTVPTDRISGRTLISAHLLPTRASDSWRIMLLMTLAYLGRCLASCYAWIRYDPTKLQHLCARKVA